MKKYTDVVTKVKRQVDQVELKMKAVRDDLEVFNDRVADVENSGLAWEVQRKQLFEKIDILENHSRRNNVKIVGLKEGYERGNPVEFFQDWIPKVLGTAHFPHGIELDRAHRALRKRPLPGQVPRSVLIKCLRYQDKEKILRVAVQNAKEHNGPMIVEGNKVFFYSDLSAEVVKKRKEFNPAKAIFWNKGYKFTFRHPATLKVFLEGNQVQFFVDEKQALKFAQSLPKICPDQQVETGDLRFQRSQQRTLQAAQVVQVEQGEREDLEVQRELSAQLDAQMDDDIIEGAKAY